MRLCHITFSPKPLICMVMVRCQITSSAHTFLLLVLLSLSSKLTDCSPIDPDRQAISAHNGPLSSALSRPPLAPELGEDKKGPNREEEEEDDLFKDVDPQTLAAVLLEALNKPQGPQGERDSEGAEDLGRGRSMEEGLEVKRGQESSKEEEREEEQQGVERDRDGREELELIMAAAAAQGKEEREREEEEERKKAAEEEERLTEKVTSRTTSQTVPLKARPAEEGQKEEPIKFGESREGEEEEEQLSPEEVKNLQNMLEEFQSYSTTTESQSAEKTGQRESRGHFTDPDSDYRDNNIRPKGFRGYNMGLKKKLKWKQQQQLEQPKAKNQPEYRGGNFMDDFNDNLSEPAVEEEEEEEEEVMSPEEEEARAKAEQEEVRRQAAEAQRAKAEEEKLADIASDMLLQYMMKQDGRKSPDQRKKNVLGMNAVEDKRSDEEEDMDDDDDIDPQTIDKLIEISSKLHLPADDVVDIISDVEKKKKKDAPEAFTWQRPLMSPPAPAPAAPSSHFPTPVQQSPLLSSPFKSRFKDRTAIKPNKQDFWLKPQKQPFRAYPPYPFYQKPYPGYYPIYFPQPKPKPRYYAKPSYAFNSLLGNSLDYGFDFPPKRRYRPWAQPWLRSPQTLQRNPYFPNYIVPNPRTFTTVPMPKPRSPARHRSAFYYPPPAPLVTRGQDYYSQRRPSEQDSDEELENFIEKVFLKRPRMFQ
ncbi:neurosecretory protein VGF [Clupea harengus]|uniref:Neurosecretory protein VGF n=1 Tax=Clupea harengus TaxID=7950 RepID=A0A6P8H006_CLUHA|nr:neurosecretory protein VGF [Clupea harengus]